MGERPSLWFDSHVGQGEALPHTHPEVHMFTSLSAAIAFHTAQAGTDYSWDGATIANSRPRSDAFPGLRQWLTEAQSGMCAACGDMLSGEVEVCHVVAARDARKYAASGSDVDASSNRGYSTSGGNLYVGHRGCNVFDAKRFGPVVPAHGFICAELVALTYPSRADMLAAARRIDVEAEQDRRDARRARMADEAEQDA